MESLFSHRSAVFARHFSLFTLPLCSSLVAACGASPTTWPLLLVTVFATRSSLSFGRRIAHNNGVRLCRVRGSIAIQSLSITYFHGRRKHGKELSSLFV